MYTKLMTSSVHAIFKAWRIVPHLFLNEIIQISTSCLNKYAWKMTWNYLILSTEERNFSRFYHRVFDLTSQSKLKKTISCKYPENDSWWITCLSIVHLRCSWISKTTQKQTKGHKFSRKFKPSQSRIMFPLPENNAMVLPEPPDIIRWQMQTKLETKRHRSILRARPWIEPSSARML